MDILLPIINLVEETSFRELIDEIIDNLRIPIRDWGVYELAKAMAFTADLERLRNLGALAASTSVVVTVDDDYYQAMILTVAASALGAILARAPTWRILRLLLLSFRYLP